MAISEREKMEKWTIEERILSKNGLTLWLKYDLNDNDKIEDFRWKVENEDNEFIHSPECVNFFHNNSEKLYGCDVEKIATSIDFYRQFKK